MRVKRIPSENAEPTAPYPVSYSDIRRPPIGPVSAAWDRNAVYDTGRTCNDHKNTLLAWCIAVGSVATITASSASADVYVRIAPPAPRYEVAPALAPGWVWAPGYWNWSGRKYVWVSGHRMHARGHHGQWVPDRWVEDHGRWRREHGHWDGRRH